MNDFLAGIGLGAVGDQLKDLRLSELLDTLPPGVDEAVAISKVAHSDSQHLSKRVQLCTHAVVGTSREVHCLTDSA